MPRPLHDLPPAAAALLAAPIVTVAWIVELLLTGGPDDRAVGVVASALVAAAGVALLGRRPAIGFVVICTGMTLAAVTAGDAVESSSTIPLTGVVSAAVTGYTARGRSRIAGVTAGSLMFVLGLLLLSGEPQDAVGVIAVLVPAVAGAAIARQRDATAALNDRIAGLRAGTATRAQAAVAAEQERVAAELRGVLATSLDVMLDRAAEAAAHVRDDPARAQMALLAVEGAGRSVMLEARQVLAVLRRPEETPSAPQRGLSGLPVLVEELRERGALVRLNDDGPVAELPPGLDLTAYRIVQSSCAGLGPGARAAIEIRREPTRLNLRVTHDGEVLRSEDLVALRVRAELHAGTLTVVTRDGQTVLHTSFATAAAA